MMDSTSLYKSRVVSAAEAVKAIKSGNRIFLTGNVSVPQQTLAALVGYAPNLQNIEIWSVSEIGRAHV